MSSSSVHGFARLAGDILTIDRTLYMGRKVLHDYRVVPLDPHPDVGFPAIRLEVIPSSPSDQTAGQHYDLIRTPTGWECSCADWTFRRANSEEPCKHLKAARAVGLLETR